jgi:hypothetical protein
MTQSKERLINIYEDCKKQRIVLNQAEFAKAVGFSRAHLFKKMEDIPEKIIDRAMKLLATVNVANETKDVISKSGDAGEEISRLIELSIKHQAALDVLQLVIEDIVASVKDKSIALVSDEIHEAVKNRADRLYDEYSKKR